MTICFKDSENRMVEIQHEEFASILETVYMGCDNELSADELIEWIRGGCEDETDDED